MFIFFIVLSAICAVGLIAGTAWWLASAGTATRRSGPDVGAEIMGSVTSDDGPEVGATLLDKSTFKGTGVSVSVENSISYGEVKRLMAERRWREVLPPLVAMIGLAGLLIFGSLALWVKMEDKLVATLIAGIVLFTMARIGYGFARAGRGNRPGPA